MGNIFSKTTTPLCDSPKIVSSPDKSVWGYNPVHATELDISDVQTEKTSTVSSNGNNVFMTVRQSENSWNYLVYFTTSDSINNRRSFLLVRSDSDCLKLIKTSFEQNGMFTITFLDKNNKNLFNVSWNKGEYSNTVNKNLCDVSTKKVVSFMNGKYSVLVSNERGGSARVSSTDLQHSGGSVRVSSTDLQHSGGSVRVSSTDLESTGGGTHSPQEIEIFYGNGYTFILGKNQVTYTRINSTEKDFQVSFGLWDISLIKIYQITDSIVLILVHTGDRNVYLSGYSRLRTRPNFTTIQLTNITPIQSWLSESPQHPRIFQKIEFLENNKFNVFFENGLKWLYQINQNGEILKTISR